MSLGFRKELFDDQFEMGLGIDDLFNRFYQGRIRYANMDIDSNNSWFTPIVNLMLAYNFRNRLLNRKKDRTGVTNNQMNRLQEGNSGLF